MNSRKVLFVAVVLVLTSQLVLLQAQTRHGVALQQLSPSSVDAKAAQIHALQQPQGVQTVVLKLAAPPVAVVRAGMPGKLLPESTRQDIVKNMQAQQAALIPLIQAQGGKVLATFQHAINGIKVLATPDEIAAMSHLPGVVAVKPVRTYTLDNALSVPFIGAPKVWQGPPGLHGEHVKVAIIDTGIDYTHANFGGPGTVAAFDAAAATSTMPADPALFGPGAPKVKGGTDLVGDAYDANIPGSIPQPDPNPLDCNGHGSHTAGTAAGFGVTAAGHTYPGPYDVFTPTQSFIIGPGVAPKADLYAVRVFGCSGSTNVVVEALDWAEANHMQVVSMSLGSSFGTEDDADSEASENLVNAGIVVVASAGNSGFIPYIVGAPSTGEKVISVAAMDSHKVIGATGANLALTPSGNILTQNSNGATFSDGTVWPVVVLRNPDHSISLGCKPAEYTAAVKNKLVVTLRGVCNRVYRAQYGQAAGAAAVAMINTSAGYPPVEGPIPGVTIPFLGVLASDGSTLAGSTSATATNTATVPNPTVGTFASFSSLGVRYGDGHLKPEITAPGVAIVSTAVGTGTQGANFSGTSMSAPHVAGTVALAKQAHPSWTAADLANSVVNTADASQLVGYNAAQGGNGLVQPYPASLTLVSAHAADDTSSLSFGVGEFASNYSGNQTLTLVNHGATAVTFKVSVVQGPSSSPHTATPSQNTVTVPGNGSAALSLKLSVPIATAKCDSNSYCHVEGRVVLTPTTTKVNNGVKLSVPYYLVSRARSAVRATLNGSISGGSGAVGVSNATGLVPGTADFYAWGLAAQHRSTDAMALRAVGVQSFADPTFGQFLVFAVNTLGRVSTYDPHEVDILVDVNGDGTPDYDIFAADYGVVTTGSRSGVMAVFIVDLATNKLTGHVFGAFSPTDGSTLLMPVVAADIGITNMNARFSYTAYSFNNINGFVDSITTAAGFNAFNNSISTGAFSALAPGGTDSVPIAYDPVEFAITPALGVMVVSVDNNTAHGGQTALLPVN